MSDYSVRIVEINGIQKFHIRKMEIGEWMQSGNKTTTIEFDNQFSDEQVTKALMDITKELYPKAIIAKGEVGTLVIEPNCEQTLEMLAVTSDYFRKVVERFMAPPPSELHGLM